MTPNFLIRHPVTGHTTTLHKARKEIDDAALAHRLALASQPVQLAAPVTSPRTVWELAAPRCQSCGERLIIIPVRGQPPIYPSMCRHGHPTGWKVKPS